MEDSSCSGVPDLMELDEFEVWDQYDDEVEEASPPTSQKKDRHSHSKRKESENVDGLDTLAKVVDALKNQRNRGSQKAAVDSAVNNILRSIHSSLSGNDDISPISPIKVPPSDPPSASKDPRSSSHRSESHDTISHALPPAEVNEHEPEPHHESYRGRGWDRGWSRPRRGWGYNRGEFGRGFGRGGFGRGDHDHGEDDLGDTGRGEYGHGGFGRGGYDYRESGHGDYGRGEYGRGNWRGSYRPRRPWGRGFYGIAERDEDPEPNIYNRKRSYPQDRRNYLLPPPAPKEGRFQEPNYDEGSSVSDNRYTTNDGIDSREPFPDPGPLSLDWNCIDKQEAVKKTPTPPIRRPPLNNQEYFSLKNELAGQKSREDKLAVDLHNIRKLRSELYKLNGVSISSETSKCTFVEKDISRLQADVRRLITNEERWLSEYKKKHPNVEETVSAQTVHVHPDKGNHWCKECSFSVDNLSEFIDHIKTKQHAETTKDVEVPWKTEPEITAPVTEVEAGPMRGTEFLARVEGFFCSLCKVFLGDPEEVTCHMRGKLHYVSFQNLMKVRPSYQAIQEVERFVLIEKSREIKRLNSDRHRMTSLIARKTGRVPQKLPSKSQAPVRTVSLDSDDEEDKSLVKRTKSSEKTRVLISDSDEEADQESQPQPSEKIKGVDDRKAEEEDLKKSEDERSRDDEEKAAENGVEIKESTERQSEESKEHEEEELKNESPDESPKRDEQPKTEKMEEKEEKKSKESEEERIRQKEKEEKKRKESEEERIRQKEKEEKKRKESEEERIRQKEKEERKRKEKQEREKERERKEHEEREREKRRKEKERDRAEKEERERKEAKERKRKEREKEEEKRKEREKEDKRRKEKAKVESEEEGKKKNEREVETKSDIRAAAEAKDDNSKSFADLDVIEASKSRKDEAMRREEKERKKTKVKTKMKEEVVPSMEETMAIFRSLSEGKPKITTSLLAEHRIRPCCVRLSRLDLRSKPELLQQLQELKKVATLKKRKLQYASLATADYSSSSESISADSKLKEKTKKKKKKTFLERSSLSDSLSSLSSLDEVPKAKQKRTKGPKEEATSRKRQPKEAKEKPKKHAEKKKRKEMDFAVGSPPDEMTVTLESDPSEVKIVSAFSMKSDSEPLVVVDVHESTSKIEPETPHSTADSICSLDSLRNVDEIDSIKMKRRLSAEKFDSPADAKVVIHKGDEREAAKSFQEGSPSADVTEGKPQKVEEQKTEYLTEKEDFKASPKIATDNENVSNDTEALLKDSTDTKPPLQTTDSELSFKTSDDDLSLKATDNQLAVKALDNESSLKVTNNESSSNEIEHNVCKDVSADVDAASHDSTNETTAPRDCEKSDVVKMSEGEEKTGELCPDDNVCATTVLKDAPLIDFSGLSEDELAETRKSIDSFLLASKSLHSTSEDSSKSSDSDSDSCSSKSSV